MCKSDPRSLFFFSLILYTTLMSQGVRYIIGIDEVGRGPLAGPVAVGAVLASRRMLRHFRDIKESKQLTPLQREEWVRKMESLLGSELRIAVSMVSAKMIDRIGIVPSIRSALARSLEKLEVNANECQVLLDGGLYAPEHFVNQQTIIRGDATHTIIAMASVVAKVHRDKYMTRLSKKYPLYDFHTHKGYGTRNHKNALKEHGPSDIHRISFCGFLKNS